jgi:hypothetical protein
MKLLILLVLILSTNSFALTSTYCHQFGPTSTVCNQYEGDGSVDTTWTNCTDNGNCVSNDFDKDNNDQNN